MGFTVKAVRKKSKMPKGIKVGGNTKVKVGFVQGKTDSDNIMKAIYNEFGTRGSGKGFKTPRGGGFGGPIPERPFFRTAMRKNKAKYRKAMKDSANKLLTGETTLDVVLNKLGTQAQDDIQQSISTWTTPGNSETTIRLKGSSKPLIDSGEMRKSVTWKLEK